jgi:hypothetical protein
MTEKTVAEIIEMCKDINPSYVDSHSLCEEFDMGWPDKCTDINILYQKYFDTWQCWDTPVGRSVIYLHDQPVAISVQTARKASVEYYFIGKFQTQAVKDYLETLYEEPLDNLRYISEETIFPIEGDEIGDSRSRKSYRS